MTEQMTQHTEDTAEIKEYRSFDDMDLHDNLLRGIYAYGYERPSSIQMKAIVPVIQRRDIIAQAQSGTGKTATFLIGSLQQIDTSTKHTQVVVIAPTRELALQILSVCTELSRYMDIQAHCAIGGTSIYNDIRQLEKGAHIVIGTPGRILHLSSKGILKLNNIKSIILDEVDEIFSTGFKDQVYDIFQYFPEECQVGLFSATMQESTLEISRKILRNPIKVFVKNDDVTLHGISQFYIDVKKEYYKFDTLLDIYDKLTISQAIIYLNSKKKAELVREKLVENGHSVSCIHGDLSQKERNDVIKDYRRGVSRILIATDIIARGIDVQQVSIVINYDLPYDKDVYIHRIGRSGRFGRKGIAINLVSEKEYQTLQTIENYYSTEISEMPMNIESYL